jgi:hypothetical protein
MSAAATTVWVVVASATRPPPIVLATAVPAKAPMKLNAKGARRDRRGDGVRRVVEAVDVVEEDGEHDDGNEGRGQAGHPDTPPCRWQKRCINPVC